MAQARALVLIIEDDSRSRKLLRDVLQFYGYSIAEAGTGEEGLALAVNTTPCLVLLDFGLPGMDGNAVLQSLRANPKTTTVPVIAVTARLGPNDAMGTEGLAGYFAKPVDIPILLSTVQRLCG